MAAFDKDRGQAHSATSGLLSVSRGWQPSTRIGAKRTAFFAGVHMLLFDPWDAAPEAWPTRPFQARIAQAPRRQRSRPPFKCSISAGSVAMRRVAGYGVGGTADVPFPSARCAGAEKATVSGHLQVRSRIFGDALRRVADVSGARPFDCDHETDRRSLSVCPSLSVKTTGKPTAL